MEDTWGTFTGGPQVQVEEVTQEVTLRGDDLGLLQVCGGRGAHGAVTSISAVRGEQEAEKTNISHLWSPAPGCQHGETQQEVAEQQRPGKRGSQQLMWPLSCSRQG